MSKKIAYVLELTESEAQTIKSLVVRGISWAKSGKMGKDAEAVFETLSNAGVNSNGFRTGACEEGYPEYPVWGPFP